MEHKNSDISRLDSAQPLKGPRTLNQFTDDEIRTADVLVLVDPDCGDWQSPVWSAPLGDGMMSSITMRVVEIAVDSREESQIREARERIDRIRQTTAGD